MEGGGKQKGEAETTEVCSVFSVENTGTLGLTKEVQY